MQSLENPKTITISSTLDKSFWVILSFLFLGPLLPSLMENSTPWLLKIFFLLTIILGYSSSSSSSASSSWLHPLASISMAEHRNYTAISDFRVLNRRNLLKCDDPNPHLKISVDPNSSLSNEEYLTVTVSGVLLPSSSDWVAMISTSSSK